ncbi:MAG: hypothetical protein ACFFAJ_05055 [Candidatus Hodarchaeota archaeon]
MFTEYSTIYSGTQFKKKKGQVFKLNKTLLKQQELIERTKEELDRLADRALLLLSFKDTPTQNLRYVLKALGITTQEEKKRILREIFWLIREGVVYIPRGLPELIEKGIDAPSNLEKVELCLLRPYEHLIQEIQCGIAQVNAKNGC